MTTRREKVILELEDQFTAGMGRATAATALFDKTLNHLSGSQVNTSKDSDTASRAVKGLGDEVEKTSTKTRGASREIDKYSGRLRLITEAAVTLGPALVPIGAVGIPAMIGLTAGLGTAAGALGVTLLAVQGLGDGLKALDAYQIEPTKANLEKMRAEMDKLGPSGAKFVRLLNSLEPELRGLQEVARAGMLPGVEEGVTSLLGLLPQVRVIIFNLATEMGHLSAEAGRALSGDGFSKFFDYLESDAAPLLASFSHTLGNVAQGFANLIVAFGPLTGDFASGMERMSQSFADWAAGLSQTQGFRDFVSYVRDTGPEVVDLLGAIATAFIGILKAAAPVGSAVLPALTALARILGTIADSPIGPALFTAVAAMLAINRAATLASSGLTKLKLSADASGASMGKLGAGANFLAILTGIGAVNAAFSSLRNNIDTADLDRNLAALARGETVSDLSNLGKEIANVGSTLTAVGDKFSDVFTLGIDTSELERSQKEIEKVDQALASLVETGQRGLAERAFAQIMAQAEASGVSAADASKNFDAYKLALDNAGPSAEEAAAATQRYTQANNLSARIARQTRTEIAGLVSAMEEQKNAALSAFDAVTQYGNALAAAREAAKKGKRGIDETTEAGRENRDALSGLAAAWNNQSDAVRNNVSKFHEARTAFVQTAVAMGVPIDRARALASRLMEIPRSVVIKLDAKADPALQAIARIKRELASVPRSISTTYYVNQINRANKGPVTGPGSQNYVGGWTGPGDKYRAVGTVHADEVVIPKELVHRDAKLLKSRYGFLPGMSNLPGYATGGFAGSTYARTRNPDGSAMWDLEGAASASARMLADFAANGKRELETRKKLLAHEVDRDKKAVDLAKEHRDAIRDNIKSLRESISQRFQSDVFGQTGSDLTSNRPDNWANMSASQQKTWLETMARVQASLTPNPLDILRSDIRQGREANSLYEQLGSIFKSSGGRLTGTERQALTYAQLNASNPELAALVGDPRMAQEYARLYGQRSEVSMAAGNTAAMQRWGDAQEAAVRELRDARGELKESNRRLRSIERELAQTRKENKTNSDDNAKRTGDGVNRAATAGYKGRVHV